MACSVCFFRDSYQQDLKRKTFGISRFEEKIPAYKSLFISGLQGLTSVADCTCGMTYNNPAFTTWTDDFLTTIKGHLDVVEQAFDEVTACYETFLEKDQKRATDRLHAHLSARGLLRHTTDALSSLFFRGRLIKGLSSNDIHEFFHIPFSKRGFVSAQRFSIHGQPMIYFGSSTLAVSKELDAASEDIRIAGFLPIYSHYYRAPIFDLKNNLNDTIENAMPGILDAGCQISYNDPTLGFNDASISLDIHRAVLAQICTFPTEPKGSFVPEYVLPQILTTALLQAGYLGLMFPSTKSQSDLDGHHRFSSHHINLGLFVTYNKKLDHDENLLRTFQYFQADDADIATANTAACTEMSERLKQKNLASSDRARNNDQLYAKVRWDLHFEYLERATVRGTPYYETHAGRTELAIALKMLTALERSMV